MATKKRKKAKKVKVRNAFALHAKMRKAPAMKHKNTPRGGAKNKQRDLQEEE